MHRAILRISLANELPALPFADMIRVMDEVYIVNLWLDRIATQNHMPGSTPKSFAPGKNEMLQIRRIEVGTPNFMELIGLADPLIQVLGFVGSALGTAQVVVSIRKKLAETDKIRAERRKLDAETKKIELDVNKMKSAEVRAENFYRQGKIDEKAYQQIRSLENLFRRIGRQVIAKYASEPSLLLEVHKPRFDGVSQTEQVDKIAGNLKDNGKVRLYDAIQVDAANAKDSTHDGTH